MKNWKELYENLPSEELDRVAILRVMECSNGVIQHAYRDGQIFALSVYETRKAMKFSMGCMKNMEIPFKKETITFAPETQELMREARDFYVRGFKQGDSEALVEFYAISKASARACGLERLTEARYILEKNVDAIPSYTLDWGLDYLKQFL